MSIIARNWISRKAIALVLPQLTDPNWSTISGSGPWRKSAARARAEAVGRGFDLILCKSDFD